MNDLVDLTTWMMEPHVITDAKKRWYRSFGVFRRFSPIVRFQAQLSCADNSLKPDWFPRNHQARHHGSTLSIHRAQTIKRDQALLTVGDRAHPGQRTGYVHNFEHWPLIAADHHAIACRLWQVATSVQGNVRAKEVGKALHSASLIAGESERPDIDPYAIHHKTDRPRRFSRGLWLIQLTRKTLDRAG